jgi:SulP family sulfate permease
MAGIFLFIFGYSRLGTYIKFIPYPVTTGFTAGIGIVLVSTELKDFFGFRIEGDLSPHFIEKCSQYFHSADTINLYAVGIGLLTIFLTIAIRRKVKKIPAHIFAIAISTAIVAIFSLPVDTIKSVFGGIPNTLPMPVFPEVTLERIRSLLPDALTIAILAGIESLLSAVIADGMTSDRHDSNTELIGQAAGNFFSGIFGGIPATGAIARTVTNVKLGARSPISGIVHAATLLLLMLFLADIAELIPMTAIAGILMVISWDMINVKELFAFRKSPRSDLAVMLVALLLTVLVDITVAVQAGVVMAALLFMKRMSDVTNLETIIDPNHGDDKAHDPDSIENKSVPDGVGVYEINGPFFFGVADKLVQTVESISNMPKIFILRMRKVPTVDATGLHALHGVHKHCQKKGVRLILSGVSLHGQTRRVIENDGLLDLVGRENVLTHIDIALARAQEILDEDLNR